LNAAPASFHRSDLHLQRRNERKRQVTVRNRRSVRALALCAFDVDTDPLAIAAALGELVDPGLIHAHPAGDPDLFADVLRNV